MTWGFLLILTVSVGCAGRVPDPDQRTLQAKKNFPPESLIKEQVYIANHFKILSHGAQGQVLNYNIFSNNIAIQDLTVRSNR